MSFGMIALLVLSLLPPQAARDRTIISARAKLRILFTFFFMCVIPFFLAIVFGSF